MYTTEQRMALVMRRAARMKRRCENRLLFELSCICIFLVGGLTFAAMTAASPGAVGRVAGLGGSILLFGWAGGYVLAAVASFAAAVAVTLICVKYRERQKRKDDHDKNYGEDNEI